MSLPLLGQATHSGPNNKKNFVSLEWFRYLLGLYIVVFHTMFYVDAPGWVKKCFEMGFFSTSAFFVLSGFLLAHVYLRDQGSAQAAMPASFRVFWVKRLANLYPIHLGSFLLMVVAFALLPSLGVLPEDASMSIRQVTLDMNNWAPTSSIQHVLTNRELYTALFMNATLLHAWNPYYLTFNFPTWSISTLFFLYLLFPVLAPWLNRLKRPGRALVLTNILYLIPVIICIAMGWFGSPETGILHRNPLIRLPEFAAGILLCSFYHQRVRQGATLTRPWAWGLLALLVASLVGASELLSYAGALSSKGNVSYFLVHDGLLLPAQLALVYLCIHIPNPDPRSILAKWAKPLGNCSLSMFALHIPLFMFFKRIDPLASGNPLLCFSDFKGCVAAQGDKATWHYLVFLVAVTLICIVFQKTFVERIRRLIEKMLLSAKGQPAPVGAKVSTPLSP